MEGTVGFQILALLLLQSWPLHISAVSNRVTSSIDEAAGTSEVLCMATNAETVEWSVSGNNFQESADSSTVENSATDPVTLHQGLTLSSTFETSSTNPALSNIESRLVFDSSFPLSGTFFCSCTARAMSSSATGGTSVHITATTNPTSPTTASESTTMTPATDISPTTSPPSAANTTENNATNPPGMSDISTETDSPSTSDAGDDNSSTSVTESSSGSKDSFHLIMIAIISVGIIIIMGTVIILVLGFIFYKKRARKSKSSNSQSSTRRPLESDLMDNGLYNAAPVTTHSFHLQTSSLRSQTDNDSAEPAVEREYLSITNLSRPPQQQGSDNTNTLPPQLPEETPEYLSITNFGQQSSDLQPLANSTAGISGDEPEYLSIRSAHLQNLYPLPQPVSLAANPSYIVKSGGMKMIQNRAYVTNQDVSLGLGRDSAGKPLLINSVSHAEATDDDHDDYTYY